MPCSRATAQRFPTRHGPPAIGRPRTGRPPRWKAALAALTALVLGSCGGQESGTPSTAGTTGSPDHEKVLSIPIRAAGPGSLDPVRGSTQYDNRACSLVYETLLQYKYLARPLALEPLLLTKMPEVSPDGLTYTFELKPDARFADDSCFPGGKGRPVTSEDVFYSWKRMADEDNEPKSWWLFKDTIVGFDRYREEQNAAETFDYDAPVEGMRVLDEHRFQVTLTEPVTRFLYVLAMFQTAIVPREAVEHYGSAFSRKPVGTGPFLMTQWVTSQRMTFVRNPNYRDERYPSEWEPEDEARGLHLAAGKRIPFVDRIEITFFNQDQPMWLEFDSNKLDMAQIPAENYDEAINKRTKTLKPKFAKRGITYVPVPLLDFIFRGFNMEDPLVGGYTPQKRALRRALALASDLEEFNETFYNSVNVIYDGMIPPGLEGYPPNGRIPGFEYRGPDIERAKRLLAEAGYPGGQGLPAIDFYTDNSANSPQQVELLRRQLGRIGVELNPHLMEFAQLIEAVNTKKAPFFSFAWGSDYPDAENNLALFYGPNEAPGSNHYNYKNEEFDLLYERIHSMPPSPERTAIYEKMRDMVMEDMPFIGSMARTRHYLIQPWLINCKPTENFWGWLKYLDLDESARPKL